MPTAEKAPWATGSPGRSGGLGGIFCCCCLKEGEKGIQAESNENRDPKKQL